MYPSLRFLLLLLTTCSNFSLVIAADSRQREFFYLPTIEGQRPVGLDLDGPYSPDNLPGISWRRLFAQCKEDGLRTGRIFLVRAHDDPRIPGLQHFWGDVPPELAHRVAFSYELDFSASGFPFIRNSFASIPHAHEAPRQPAPPFVAMPEPGASIMHGYPHPTYYQAVQQVQFPYAYDDQSSYGFAPLMPFPATPPVRLLPPSEEVTTHFATRIAQLRREIANPEISSETVLALSTELAALLTGKQSRSSTSPQTPFEPVTTPALPEEQQAAVSTNAPSSGTSAAPVPAHQLPEATVARSSIASTPSEKTFTCPADDAAVAATQAPCVPVALRTQGDGQSQATLPATPVVKLPTRGLIAAVAPSNEPDHATPTIPTTTPSATSSPTRNVWAGKALPPAVTSSVPAQPKSLQPALPAVSQKPAPGICQSRPHNSNRGSKQGTKKKQAPIQPQTASSVKQKQESEAERERIRLAHEKIRQERARQEAEAERKRQEKERKRREKEQLDIDAAAAVALIERSPAPRSTRTSATPVTLVISSPLSATSTGTPSPLEQNVAPLKSLEERAREEQARVQEACEKRRYPSAVSAVTSCKQKNSPHHALLTVTVAQALSYLEPSHPLHAQFATSVHNLLSFNEQQQAKIVTAEQLFTLYRYLALTTKKKEKQMEYARKAVAVGCETLGADHHAVVHLISTVLSDAKAIPPAAISAQAANDVAIDLAAVTQAAFHAAQEEAFSKEYSALKALQGQDANTILPRMQSFFSALVYSPEQILRIFQDDQCPDTQKLLFFEVLFSDKRCLKLLSKEQFLEVGQAMDIIFQKRIASLDGRPVPPVTTSQQYLTLQYAQLGHEQLTALFEHALSSDPAALTPTKLVEASTPHLEFWPALREFKDGLLPRMNVEDFKKLFKNFLRNNVRRHCELLSVFTDQELQNRIAFMYEALTNLLNTSGSGSLPFLSSEGFARISRLVDTQVISQINQVKSVGTDATLAYLTHILLMARENAGSVTPTVDPSNRFSPTVVELISRCTECNTDRGRKAYIKRELTPLLDSLQTADDVNLFTAALKNCYSVGMKPTTLTCNTSIIRFVADYVTKQPNKRKELFNACVATLMQLQEQHLALSAAPLRGSAPSPSTSDCKTFYNLAKTVCHAQGPECAPSHTSDCLLQLFVKAPTPAHVVAAMEEAFKDEEVAFAPFMDAALKLGRSHHKNALSPEVLRKFAFAFSKILDMTLSEALIHFGQNQAAADYLLSLQKELNLFLAEPTSRDLGDSTRIVLDPERDKEFLTAVLAFRRCLVESSFQQALPLIPEVITKITHCAQLRYLFADPRNQHESSIWYAEMIRYGKQHLLSEEQFKAITQQIIKAITVLQTQPVPDVSESCRADFAAHLEAVRTHAERYLAPTYKHAPGALPEEVTDTDEKVRLRTAALATLHSHRPQYPNTAKMVDGFLQLFKAEQDANASILTTLKTLPPDGSILEASAWMAALIYCGSQSDESQSSSLREGLALLAQDYAPRLAATLTAEEEKGEATAFLLLLRDLQTDVDKLRAPTQTTTLDHAKNPSTIS